MAMALNSSQPLDSENGIWLEFTIIPVLLLAATQICSSIAFVINRRVTVSNMKNDMEIVRLRWDGKVSTDYVSVETAMAAIAGRYGSIPTNMYGWFDHIRSRNPQRPHFPVAMAFKLIWYTLYMIAGFQFMFALQVSATPYFWWGGVQAAIFGWLLFNFFWHIEMFGSNMHTEFNEKLSSGIMLTIGSLICQGTALGIFIAFGITVGWILSSVQVVWLTIALLIQFSQLADQIKNIQGIAAGNPTIAGGSLFNAFVAAQGQKSYVPLGLQMPVNVPSA